MLITIVVVLSAVLLVWIGSIILSNAIEKKIRDKSTIGGYKIEFEELNINLLTRNATVKNVDLVDSLGGQTISVKEIEIHKFHLFAALFNKKYKVKSVLISNPNLSFVMPKNQKNQESHQSKKGDQIPKINIKKLEIEDAEITISKADSISLDTIFNTQLNFEMNSISTYDTTLQYATKWGNFERLEFQLANTRYIFPNRLYRIETHKLNYNSSEKEVRLDSFALKSEYSKYEIAQQTGVETDWLDISTNAVILSNLDLSKILIDTTFAVSEIKIPELSIDVFRDKRLPFPQKPDTKLPSKMIDDLPFGLHVDSVLIENGNIKYEERRKNNDEPGSITFNNLDATIYSVSNQPDLIHTESEIDVSANVLNDALLSVQFKLPNQKYPVAYSAIGRLQPMPLKPFNSIIRSSASALLTSGKINELSFDFVYNNDKSNGNVRFEYEDLKVTLIDPEEGDEKKVNSFLLNTFIVRDQNPDNNNLREGKIEFERDKKRAIFNYWWKSLMSGLKDVVAG